VGRGLSGATLVPTRDADEPADSDRRLVAAVRRGDDRAFEVLYARYQRRIHAYVFGMVKDHGRAEDVTQEVFVSALRRMRETEQPLAFKPWLYQIAKNGCIDAFRRSKRAEEVSYDADDALAPADHSKLVGAGPSPDAAVAAKQDLDNLCGAFGGLSETHHEILVLRELEGLSYQEIGTRMGMSRPGVESTLFRARRRLTEEYDDIVSGARCLRIEQIIGSAVETELGARDTRRLARHLSHCQSCRREALAAGLDRGLFTRPNVRERVASRIAGFFPFPAFLKFRRGGAGTDPAAGLPQPGRWSAHLPMLSDQLSSGWGKAAAGAALVVAGVGGAAGVHQVTTPPPSSSAVKHRPALVTPARASTTTSTTSAAPKRPVVLTRDSGGAPKSSAAKHERKPASAPKASEGSHRSVAAGRPASGGGGPAPTPTGSNPNPARGRSDGATAGGGSGASGGGGGGGAKTGGGGGSSPAPTPTPSVGGVSTPAAGAAVPAVTQTVDNTVQQTTGAVQNTTHQTTQAVDDTVNQVTGGGPVADTVDQVTNTVDNTVDDVTNTVGDVVGGLTGALGGGHGG
jgi:RNA polymerase sigma factor (sigma-70 family)